MAHDLVIKNGTVVDGTGSAGFAADVAVDGDKISAIGKTLGSGKKEIDAKGHEMGVKPPYARRGVDYFTKNKIFPIDGAVTMPLLVTRPV